MWCDSIALARAQGGGGVESEWGRSGWGSPAVPPMQQEINDKGKRSEVTARHGSCYGRGVETSCVWFQVDEAVMCLWSRKIVGHMEQNESD